MRLWSPHDKPDSCRGCTRYFLGRGFVPGVGDEAARLVVVGEQPGPNEVREGAPFVGRSGTHLDRGLGRTRDGAFITNVRKCMGPEHEPRDIRLSSIEHCVRIYLQEELNYLGEARCVQAMGADALKVLVGYTEAVKCHGAVWTRGEADAAREQRGFKVDDEIPF